jgi:hypothetical protein
MSEKIVVRIVHILTQNLAAWSSAGFVESEARWWAQLVRYTYD